MSLTDLGRVVVGHRQASTILAKALDGDRLSHAYLLTGPARVGKTTLARAFAQALNCEAATRPCGECRACRLIARDAHPDFRVLRVGGGDGDGEASSGERTTSRSIRIEQVRALQRDAAMAPYEARRKVYVVADAQALTDEAANCLLKTLEEPPPHVVLILTAEEPSALPPTIVSRCQRVRLATAPASEIEAALAERWGAGAAQTRLLARLCGGRVGWAVEALSSPEMLEERSERLADLRALSRGGQIERFAYAEKLAQDYSRDPGRVVRVLDLWANWWRDALLLRAGCEDLIGNGDLREELRRPAEQLSVEQLRGVIRSIDATTARLASNVNPRLALEALMLDLPAA